MTRRFSKQRKLIYDMIVNNPVHPSADVIYNHLKDEHPELSLGTVYRNLSVLSEMGLITKITSNALSECFDGRCEPHYHMICKKCKCISDLDIPYMNTLVDNTQKYTEHEIHTHQTLFYGICKNCLYNS